MHFTDTFIRRPVFATVLSLIILLVGLRAFMSLPVREYPNIQPSIITITTNYPGATSNLMEGFVSTPLENSLAGINGVDYMTSQSKQGTSIITIYFKLGYDINTAMADVTNAISSVRSNLPNGTQDPIIAKQDPSANPTFYISFQSNKMTPEAVTDYLVRVVQPQLQTLPGVSQAMILGERKYAMRLWLDPKSMAAHNVTASDILNALASNNVQAAPGTLQAPQQALTINASTDLKTPEQFDNMVIRKNGDYLLRLRDVGHAVLGPQDNESSSVNINGDKTAVVIGVVPQATANPLDVTKAVSGILPQIKQFLPDGMTMFVPWDSSKFIVASLKEVRKTILEATIFVGLVIYLFLGSLRSVIIPLVTIPLALIGVCLIMLMLGYSLNILTLLAWVLAIGLVVDDSIVVLENIHRHIEEGKTPFEAAIIGAREIGFAVIAMTITLAAVYAPIGFLTDLTGQLFREFAFTLAGSVIVSGFIALTLSPMMTSRLIKHEDSKDGLVAKVDALFARLMTAYRSLLNKILDKRKLVLIGAGIVYLSCYFLYATMPHELAPTEDQGYLLTLAFGPTSANLKYTEKYTNEISELYKNIPEMETFGVINGIPNGPTSGLSFIILKPWDQRKKSSMQISQDLFGPLWGITGVSAFPVTPPPLPGTNADRPVQFVLKTTGTYDDLDQAIKKLTEIASKNPGLQNLDTDLKLDTPQVQITIDRNRANILGISMNDIATGLNTLLGEPTASQFDMNGRSYYVIPQLGGDFTNNPDRLQDINLRTASGAVVPLSNIVQIKMGTSPQSLNHFQQLRRAIFQANLAPGYALGDALSYLEEQVNTQLPKNIQFDFSGASRQFIQASGGMTTTLLFAVIIIFLVLAAQFESFRDPLIVMVSVPLSLTGALMVLHIIGATMNIYTQIGLVTLVGLITKHGILLVEFANQQQEKGLGIRDAIIESASLRLRPILMTTGAMLLGALPLLLASGAGAVSRSQLGWTVFGGMAFGTCLTLFVVPVVYTLLATKKEKDIRVVDDTTLQPTH